MGIDQLGVLVLLPHVRRTGLPKSKLSRMAYVWTCEEGPELESRSRHRIDQ
jgi:hypothetical protein